MSDISSEERDRLTFQQRGEELRDELERVLADSYGEVWFDWSGHAGRLKVAVTTRCDRSTLAVAEKLIVPSLST